MKRILLVSLVSLLFGCAYTSVRPVTMGDTETKGFRYYDPMTVLLVGCSATQVLFVPDATKGYAVRPGAILTKNDFTLKISNGMLTEVITKLDSTAPLTLIQNVAEKVAENLDKFAALGVTANASATRRSGKLYQFVMGTNGELTLRDLKADLPCPAPAAPATRQPGTPANAGAPR